MHVLVVGAGLTGLATSVVLSERGHRVILVEAASAPCREASFDVGAVSGDVRGVWPAGDSDAGFMRRMSGGDAALHYGAKTAMRRPGFIRALAKVGSEPLAPRLERQALFRRLAQTSLLAAHEQYGLPISRSIGILSCRTTSEAPKLLEGEIALDERYALAAEPGLCWDAGIRSAAFQSDAFVFSASLLARTLRERLVKDPSYITTVSSMERAVSLLPTGGAHVQGPGHCRDQKAQAVVIAAGLGADPWLKTYLPNAVVAPLTRGSMTALKTGTSPVTPAALRIDDDLLAAPSGEHFRVVGPWLLGHRSELELDDYHRRLWQRMMTYFPNGADWNGARYYAQSVLSTADGWPILGPDPAVPDLFWNCAGGMHGTEGAFLFAEMTADLIEKKAIAQERLPILDAVRPDRFLR